MHFIFEVHIKPGYSAEAYADAWLEASKMIQQAPGARGTRLHRKIGQSDVLLAIATWESKQARDAMEARRDIEIQSIIDSQSPYVDIKVIGEFYEPQWVVLPPGAAAD